MSHQYVNFHKKNWKVRIVTKVFGLTCHVIPFSNKFFFPPLTLTLFLKEAACKWDISLHVSSSVRSKISFAKNSMKCTSEFFCDYGYHYDFEVCLYIQPTKPKKDLLTRRSTLQNIFSSMLLCCSIESSHVLSAQKHVSFFRDMLLQI